MVTLNRALLLGARAGASPQIRSAAVLTWLLTDLSFTGSRCWGHFAAGDPMAGIWGKKLGEESIIYFHSDEMAFL